MHQSGTLAEEPSVANFTEDTLLEHMLLETLNPDHPPPPELRSASAPAAPNRKQALLALRERATHYALQLQPLLRRWVSPEVRVQLSRRKLLPFSELAGLATGRSYFNLVSIEAPRSLWTMHCSRSLAEGLARQRLRQRRGWQKETDWLGEGAHSAVFLEIGEFLRRSRDAMLEDWGVPLAVSGYRPVLQPRFTREATPSDEYAVLSYQVESPEVSGDLHWAIPVSAVVAIFGNAPQAWNKPAGLERLQSLRPA